MEPAVPPDPARDRTLTPGSGLLPHPAVQVVRRIHVAARVTQVLDDEDAPAHPLLLPVRILLLPAHSSVYLRYPGYTPDHAHLHARSRPSHQLRVHRSFDRV